MSFLQDLQSLVANYDSDKIKALKKKLQTLASEGKTETTLSEHEYDRDVKFWLESQGLKVSEINDQRDGDSLHIGWKR